MTIAAGFCCSDGLVMCADSQASAGDHKFSVQKLVTNDTPPAQLVIAGSGLRDLVEMAAQRIQQQLLDCYPDYKKVPGVIGDALKDLYSEEFKEYPIGNRDDTNIDLLIGYKYGNRRPILFKTSATTVSQVRDYALIGSGRVVQYRIQDLFRSSMTVSKGVLLAVQLLTIAKSTLNSVGGRGQIATLFHDDTRLREEPSWRIADVEWALGQLDARTGRFALDAVDLGLSEDEYHLRLKKLVSEMSEMRNKVKQKIADSAALEEMVASDPEF